MPHVFEVAPTGRAKCRACAATIAKGELRFGERSPNPYGEGEMTQWFHPVCAAFKRAEPLLEALPEAPQDLEDKGGLETRARATLEHRRLERVDGAERSPTAQAKCRHCRERIERGAWRIRLTFYESGRFSPGGFVHLTCYPAYFEGHDVLDRIQHFSPSLEEADRTELEQAYRAVPPFEGPEGGAPTS